MFIVPRISTTIFCLPASILLSFLLPTNSIAQPPATSFALGGVKPGMSKAEAIAAIERTYPAFRIYEFNTTGFTNGEKSDVDMSSTRPDDIAFFWHLKAVYQGEASRKIRGSSADTEPMSCGALDYTNAPIHQEREIDVYFNSNLSDQRVEFIKDFTKFCVHPSSASVLKSLYSEFPKNKLVASVGLTQDGAKLTLDGYNEMFEGLYVNAIMRWKPETTGMSSSDLSFPQDSFMLSDDEWGLKGGGIAAEARLEAEQVGGQSNLIYIDTLVKYLWDEDLVFHDHRKAEEVVANMDNLNINYGNLRSGNNISKLMSATFPGGAYVKKMASDPSKN